MDTARKNAIILTADRFEDLELFYPLFRLREMGWHVDIAAPVKKKISGEHGYALDPTLPISEASADQYDLLIIPGGRPGGAPDTVRKSRKAREITQSFFADNKLVASICHGPWTLASANVLRGRHLTSYWHDGVQEDIKAAGGIWGDKEVVVDGNLITSRWPMDLSRRSCGKLRKGPARQDSRDDPPWVAACNGVSAFRMRASASMEMPHGSKS